MNGPSYRFRLERVRALRERREDQAKLELVSAMQQQEYCRQELTAAETRIADARRSQLESATSSASELLARQAYLERTESAHRSTLDDLERHDAQVAQRRDALTQAAQARRALERLKEKGLAAHRRELERIERFQLDEIAINGYRRGTA